MLVYKWCKLHANLTAAFFSRSKEKRKKIRNEILDKYSSHFVKYHRETQELIERNRLSIEANRLNGELENIRYIQNVYFPSSLEKTKKLIIIIVPEHGTMSGGIFSMFSIGSHLKRTKVYHGYDVVLMTRPNKTNYTYFRNMNFVNSENVYRFEQIDRLKSAKEVYLHIPEYATVDFVKNLTNEQKKWLQSLNKLDINILNQNIKLMPEADEFSSLKELTNSITQSVAHHAYFSQEMADRYDIPTLFLPAYTDLTSYPKVSFEQKEKLIIYSLDDAPFKKKTLSLLRKKLPDFKLVEIRDITFDVFMDYATRCMFSISFGEGFDGYVAQPIYQGGIGITVYNDDFFPSQDFKKYPNFFDSPEDLLANICDKILYYSTHPDQYNELNKELVSEYDKLYTYQEYIDQIAKLANKEFEIFPNKKNRQLKHLNKKTLKKSPTKKT